MSNLSIVPSAHLAPGAHAPEPPTGAGAGPGGAGRAPDIGPPRGGSESEPRVFAVTSGKGGVGKSVLSANLGVCLAKLGRKVLLVDADLALANLDLMLGIDVRTSVNDVLSSHSRAVDVMMEGPHGVHLLPACSGDVKMADMDDTLRQALFSAIDTLEDRFDTVVIDTGAGIGSNSTSFAAAAQQTLVVVTPDPASMADAYAMVKVLNVHCGVKRIYLVVNMASGPAEADQVVSRLLDLVDQFLDVALVPVGYVYKDDVVQQSVRRCQPLVTTFPRAPVTASLQALAGRLLQEKPSDSAWGGPRLFWKRLVGVQDEESSS